MEHNREKGAEQKIEHPILAEKRSGRVDHFK